MGEVAGATLPLAEVGAKMAPSVDEVVIPTADMPATPVSGIEIAKAGMSVDAMRKPAVSTPTQEVLSLVDAVDPDIPDSTITKNPEVGIHTLANGETAIPAEPPEDANFAEGGGQKHPKGPIPEGSSKEIADNVDVALTEDNNTPVAEGSTDDIPGETSPDKPAAEQLDYTPAEPKSILARQTETNQQITDLEAKGDNRTDEENKQLTELQDKKAEFDEFSALKHKKLNEGNTGGLTAEEQKRYDELDATLNPKEQQENPEDTTEAQVQQLNQELKDIQKELIDGDLTPQQANDRLAQNQNARESLMKGIMKRLEQGDKNLTPFEKEVAEKALEMQQLMQEIRMAPKVMDAMEQVIKKLKKDFASATRFKITPENANSDEARKNTALRGQLANQIAGQAAHMARYADITSINCNEYRSVNSSLMKLMGVRGYFADAFVQIGTSISRRANTYKTDIIARGIVQRA